MAGMPAFHGVRGVDAGHEIEWFPRGAGSWGGDMDVTEQPSVEAGIAEVAFCHVEIALLGIETEALDIAVGDADVQHAGRLFCIRHPADGVLCAVFARARARVKADLVIVAFEIPNPLLG